MAAPHRAAGAAGAVSSESPTPTQWEGDVQGGPRSPGRASTKSEYMRDAMPPHRKPHQDLINTLALGACTDDEDDGEGDAGGDSDGDGAGESGAALGGGARDGQGATRRAAPVAGGDGVSGGAAVRPTALAGVGEDAELDDFDRDGLATMPGFFRPLPTDESGERRHSTTSAGIYPFAEELMLKQQELRWMAEKHVELEPTETAAVQYKRILAQSEGDENPFAGSEDIALMIVRALRLRQKYMRKSRQFFPPHIAKVVNRMRQESHIETTADRAAAQTFMPPTSPSPVPVAAAAAPAPVAHVRSSHSISSSGDVLLSDEDMAGLEFETRKGVINVVSKEDKTALFKYIDAATYLRDMSLLLAFVADGPSKSYAFRRLQYLKSKFNLHQLLNETDEVAQQKKVPHRDFYNVRKVDTHVHLSACMNQKHLLRFIKSKVKEGSDQIVIHRDGKDLTLAEVFESLKLTAYDLSIDSLDMHADRDTFHRFDRFNMKYNPLGETRLREIFLKTDNKVQGRFFAEVVRQVIDDLEDSKYQMAEYRVSVYGRNPMEWHKLAAWFVDNKLQSENVRWVIQVPRLCNVYMEKGQITSFQDVLDNLFMPLFEATKNPGKYPELSEFLQHVIAFDSVDDESKPERVQHTRKSKTPEGWTNSVNPPYSYYIYYMYANLTTLNQFRESRGMNTFALRPHAGEAGSVDHLAACFLAAENISHGILLRKIPVMQYLFYLSQIGVAMSPLSNNSLFLDIHRNPFPDFFACGMCVSLSTDDPLQFHYTREPLMEEYSISAQVWKMSSCDMCEIACNSVKMSGYSDELKTSWIGDWKKPGPGGNNIKKTNVPNIRAAYRYETWLAEIQATGCHTDADEA